MWRQREASRKTDVAELEPIREVRTPPAPSVRPMSTIGKSMRIIGSVVSQEDLAIDGWVDGSVTVANHRLVLGEGSKVVGDLLGQTVTVAGAVTGDITAATLIDIRPTGQVDGDIRAPRIAVRDGAEVRGRVATAARERAKRAEEPRQAERVEQVERRYPIAV